MHSIAILGFFSLVIVFFFTGRNDFGLKPTAQKIISNEQNNIDEEIKLEEVWIYFLYKWKIDNIVMN